MCWHYVSLSKYLDHKICFQEVSIPYPRNISNSLPVSPQSSQIQNWKKKFPLPHLWSFSPTQRKWCWVTTYICLQTSRIYSLSVDIALGFCPISKWWGSLFLVFTCWGKASSSLRSETRAGNEIRGTNVKENATTVPLCSDRYCDIFNFWCLVEYSTL